MFIPLNISIEELVCQESFQQYCLGSDLNAQLIWEEWITNNPSRTKDIEEAKKLFYILSAKQGNRLEQLNQLKIGIQQSESFRNLLSDPIEVETTLPVRRLIPFPAVYKFSAGIAAVLLIGLLFYVFPFQTANKHTASNINQEKSETFSNVNLPRKTFVLADGSVVTLRSNSSLKLLPSFNKSKREVWLSGEAFFDIQHDTLSPFVVHTLWTDIKVLGTTFNVQAYPNASATETTLLTGSVEVKLKAFPEETILLKPNQKLVNATPNEGTRGSNEKSFTIQSLPNQPAVKSTKETAWVRGRLEIDNQPLSVIAKKLEEWHGISIAFEDEKVKSLRYSGVFENENIINTLLALQLSYPFAFKIEHDTIIISMQKDRAPTKTEHN